MILPLEFALCFYVMNAVSWAITKSQQFAASIY